MNILKRIVGMTVTVLVLSSCASTWVTPDVNDKNSAGARVMDRQ